MTGKLSSAPPARRRGRPPKFGRPARLVAVTLPNDVVEWLAAMDPDLGRAIVRIHDQSTHRDSHGQVLTRPDFELVDVGEGRALIVVDPRLVRGVAGVAAIPFGESRAFLALEPTWTMADLELSIVDALDEGVGGLGRRPALARFRDQLRGWRTDRSMAMETRAIIVAGKTSRKRPGRGGGAAG